MSAEYQKLTTVSVAPEGTTAALLGDGGEKDLRLVPIALPMLAPVSVSTEDLGDFCLCFRLKGDGKDDWKETIEKPQELAQKVFACKGWKEKGNGAGLKDEDWKKHFKADKMTKEEYADAMAKTIVAIFTHPNFGGVVKTKVSVDEDEIFVGVRLTEEVLPMAAEHFEYRMPVKPELLENPPPPATDNWLDKMPMGPEGKKFPTHAAYYDEFIEMFQPFRSVDRLRLLNRRINDFIDLSALQSQGLIPGLVAPNMFPLHEWGPATELAEGFGNMWKMALFHTDEELQKARDYLGEDVAFFFLFVRFMSKMLIIPAVVAIIFRLYVTFFLPIDPEHLEEAEEDLAFQNYLKFGFGVVITTWSAYFMGGFRREQHRWVLKWGMNNYGAVAEVLKEYDESQAARDKANRFKLLTPILSAVMISLILGGVYCLSVVRKHLIDTGVTFGPMGGGDIVGLMITAQIKGLDFIWGQIAGMLVKYENHKTAAEMEKARIYKILYVKLLNVTFPFAYTAFAKRFVEQCTMDFEKTETCLPELSKQLLMYFFIHVGVTCSKIVAFSVIAKFQVDYEFSQAKKNHPDKKYSYLEVQAKCMPAPPITDEYFEMAIGFLLVCFFGTILPSMALLAFLANMLEIRLIGFRYARVTRRPKPSGSEGIGAWEYVFEFITQCAILVMPTLLVFQMHPIRDYHRLTEWELFMLIEHLFILLKMVIDAIMGSVPFDVRKAQEVQEDAGMDLFSTTERGHIQLPKQYKDAGGKVLLGSDAYTPVTPDCGPNAK